MSRFSAPWNQHVTTFSAPWNGWFFKLGLPHPQLHAMSRWSFLGFLALGKSIGCRLWTHAALLLEPPRTCSFLAEFIGFIGFRGRVFHLGDFGILINECFFCCCSFLWCFTASAFDILPGHNLRKKIVHSMRCCFCATEPPTTYTFRAEFSGFSGTWKLERLTPSNTTKKASLRLFE